MNLEGAFLLIPSHQVLVNKRRVKILHWEIHLKGKYSEAPTPNKEHSASIFVSTIKIPAMGRVNLESHPGEIVNLRPALWIRGCR